MSDYSNTLAVLRHYLSSSVGDLIHGQCGTTGATTAKIYAPFLWKADDYYNDNYYEVYVYAGTNIGVTKRAINWVLTDLLLTVHSVYDAACDATSYVELHRFFTEDEYRKAINLSIESLKENYLIDMADETITLVADDYGYTLPSGMTHVHRVITEDEADSGLFYQEDELDARSWELVSPRTLKLNQTYYTITAGRDLRVEGHGRQELLTTDTSICYLPPDWLIQKAITFLPQPKMQSHKLEDTFRMALATSFVEPRAYPKAASRKVIE